MFGASFPVPADVDRMLRFEFGPTFEHVRVVCLALRVECMVFRVACLCFGLSVSGFGFEMLWRGSFPVPAHVDRVLHRCFGLAFEMVPHLRFRAKREHLERR